MPPAQSPDGAVTPAGAAAAGSLWDAVDRLVDSTADIHALRAHRLHLLAARRWRELGREVPASLERDERLATVVALVVPELLRRVASLRDRPVVVHKGPEIAARYPDPVLRPYFDLDLLVEDAPSTQRALVSAGFVEVGDPVLYKDAAHEPPLVWPGLPVLVEVHHDPNWPSWLGRPPTAELLEGASPSSLGIDGVWALAPVHHALVVAAHSWAHGPMARVGDLLDVSVMEAQVDRSELYAVAGRWGATRLLRTTLACAESVLHGKGRPWALRLWARNLAGVEERTVLDTHIGRWLAGFSALGTRQGARAMAAEIRSDLRPSPAERWGTKLRRARLAIGNARVKRSVHDEQFEQLELTRQQRGEPD